MSMGLRGARGHLLRGMLFVKSLIRHCHYQRLGMLKNIRLMCMSSARRRRHPGQTVTPQMRILREYSQCPG